MTSLEGARLCVVGMHFAPESTGNAPYTTALTEALVDAGAAVLVVTGVPHYPEWKVRAEFRSGMRWSERDGRRVVLRRRHWVPRVPNVFGRALMEGTFLAQALTTVPGFSVDGYIAVTPMLSSLATVAAASKVHRKPWGALVQDLTGLGAKQSGASGDRVAGSIAQAEYQLLARADRVAVVASEFADTLSANGVEPARISLTPNFSHIRVAHQRHAEARAELGWPQDRFLLVHTGNMGMKQGLEVAVEAARIGEESGLFDLVLVGDGNQRAAVERLADGLRNVHFVDPLSDELYPLALAAADALLVIERSTAGQMSIPSKLTSYFAAGRPVIGSVPQGGITDRVLTESRGGLSVSAGSSHALCSAIESLRYDEELRDSLALAGPVYADTAYSLGQAHARYVDFASGLISKRESIVRPGVDAALASPTARVSGRPGETDGRVSAPGQTAAR